MNPNNASIQPVIEGLGYTQHGTGPECVLVLHDWLGDHTSYDSVIPYLDGAMFTYVFADLRGYGKSFHITGNYTVQEIAADCLKLADSLGWQHFHLMGHSMTGMAVQRIAADAPSRIKSVVAVCPISAAGNQMNDEALNFFASTGESDDNFRRLIKYVSGGLSDQWANAKLRQNRETVAPACRLGYLNMLTKTNFVNDVRGLEMPYLIVIAERDPGLDEDAMKNTFLAWYPNAELLTIPNCGHYPMQECPPYFATIIEKFLHSQIRIRR
ncbi:alpha/beta fold hydrolase [Glaciimonas sp. GS1]|uniref:Alpha/beta fold hydrolase n=2 Tax=Glaciimonas soli TaxID=2590999 RepID=A0A843YWT2_9BURK|nr:alpha/beta fold hydrolase [Glaciimonas soli]